MRQSKLSLLAFVINLLVDVLHAHVTPQLLRQPSLHSSPSAPVSHLRQPSPYVTPVGNPYHALRNPLWNVGPCHSPTLPSFVPLATVKEEGQDTVTWYMIEGEKCIQQTIPKKKRNWFYKNFRGYKEGTCEEQGFTEIDSDFTKQRPFIGDIRVLNFKKDPASVTETAAKKPKAKKAPAPAPNPFSVFGNTRTLKGGTTLRIQEDGDRVYTFPVKRKESPTMDLSQANNAVISITSVTLMGVFAGSGVALALRGCHQGFV